MCNNQQQTTNVTKQCTKFTELSNLPEFQKFKITEGQIDRTNDWTYSPGSASNVTATITGNRVQITSITADSGTYEVLCNRDGYSQLSVNIGVVKSKKGDKGDVGFTPWTISGSDIYYNTGNVAIGTDTATYRLTVEADVVDYVARILNTNNSVGANGLLVQAGGTSSGTDVFTIQNDTGTNTYMIVQATGYVGFGLSSPLDILHARDANPVLKLENTSGIVGDGGEVLFGHFFDLNNTPIASIKGYLTANGSDSSTRTGELVFSTKQTGSGPIIEAMRIDDEGRVISDLILSGETKPYGLLTVGDGNIVVRGTNNSISVWNDSLSATASLSDGDSLGGSLLLRTSTGGSSIRLLGETLGGAFATATFAKGSVEIKSDIVKNSAILELESTTGALLLPRMTTTQRDALTAVNGMIIYNSTTNKFQGYENGAWTNLI